MASSVKSAIAASGTYRHLRQLFGLPTHNVNLILVPDTGPASTRASGTTTEAILDVERHRQGVHHRYVTWGPDRNVDDAAIYLIEENLAPISSTTAAARKGSCPPTPPSRRSTARPWA